MTTDTEIVDPLEKHEFFIGGMRIMTGYTALSKDNAMHVWYRIFFIQQVLFIIVTGDAKPEGALSP